MNLNQLKYNFCIINKILLYLYQIIKKMNKLVMKVGIYNTKYLNKKYRLKLKIYFIDDSFVLNYTKKSNEVYFRASNGFVIYSNSFGKIIPEYNRLRLPDLFFYNPNDNKDNFITYDFETNNERYDYLIKLKNALTEWSTQWEEFKTNEKFKFSSTKILYSDQFWII